MKISKRIMIGLGLLAVSVLVFGLAGRGLVQARRGQNAQAVGLVTSLQVIDRIETTGSLEARQTVALAWKTSGTVRDVLVQPSDRVTVGQALLALDPISAPASVNQARSEHLSAQHALDDLLQPSPLAFASAGQAVAGAYSRLHQAQVDLKNEWSQAAWAGDAALSAEITAAESELQTAQNELPLAAASREVQVIYQAVLETERLSDQEEETSPGDTTSEDTYRQALAAQQAVKAALGQDLEEEDEDRMERLAQAQVAYEDAVADFAGSLTGASAQEYATRLNAARADYSQAGQALAQAIADWQELYAPDPEDVEAAQARLDAALSTVSTLALAAPLEGEVLEVYQQPGDPVTSGALAVVIASRSQLFVEAQVDESDIAGVRVGSPVEITLDSAPGLALTGIVEEINPLGQVVQGLVKYTVRVRLEEAPGEVLLGATANLVIQAGAPVDGTAVPVEAIQSDDQGEYVTVLEKDGATRRVSVESGEMEGSLVIVTGNLAAGQQVLLAAASETNAGGGLGLKLPFGGGQ